MSHSKAPNNSVNLGWTELAQKAEAFLAARAQAARLRTLEPIQPSWGNLDLTHNDYLGLRHDPIFQERVQASIAGLPVGAGASRLLGGEFAVFRELEQQFAKFKGAPDALYFSSGYAANEAVAASLAQLGGRIFSDSLNHASIIDGIRLSGLAKADRVIYPHGDLDQLEALLAQSDASHNLIFSETLFSMDGDRPDLRYMTQLAETYRGILVLDEAHAIGCCGPSGRGLATEQVLDSSRVLTVNTCGKALGVQGALVCGPSWFRDLLINTARPFIFSTGPSPWLAAALQVAITYMVELDDRRIWLGEMSERLITHLQQLGFDTGTTSSHIIPILCGPDQAALDLAERLTQLGLKTRAIRPPTVPEGTSRVRLSLHAGITPAEFEFILDCFKKVAP